MFNLLRNIYFVLQFTKFKNDISIHTYQKYSAFYIRNLTTVAKIQSEI